jgi:hypothetical protein
VSGPEIAPPVEFAGQSFESFECWERSMLRALEVLVRRFLDAVPEGSFRFDEDEETFRLVHGARYLLGELDAVRAAAAS